MRNIVRWLLRLVVNLIATVEVRGYENIPSSGAFVIATNHLGMLDATMLFYALSRWDVFIPVAEKWEKNAFLRWLGKYLNFIYIDRFNPDLKAMRQIIGLMENGNILVIAPEGTRSRTATMAEGKPGVSYLAAKLNRPILPVGLAGTEDKAVIDNLKHFRRSHLVATAGKPFTLPPLPTKDRDAALKQYTDEIMCQIAALVPAKYRGVYADHPRLKELLAQK
ncbi:MAG TPA: lysophospholipid acyltransferase family protein [Anaerolineales bacterium]|jgi:1-acyl-sn-glycerol-3-phosphate acyltransferase|nr:lysophospholipid acyltransferase family protein [Anaerolineales bacterium]